MVDKVNSIQKPIIADEVFKALVWERNEPPTLGFSVLTLQGAYALYTILILHWFDLRKMGLMHAPSMYY